MTCDLVEVSGERLAKFLLRRNGRCAGLVVRGENEYEKGRWETGFGVGAGLVVVWWAWRGWG